MNASRRPDAIVVGAGIVGAACAAALATDGWRVTILERAFASAGTTSVGMGHVVVMDDSRDQLALTTYSDRLWRELGPELDARSELDKCGTLWVAEDDAQLEAVRTKQSVYASAGIASEVLDEQGLHEAEPCLRPGLVGALLVPGDSVVYPPGATLRLLARAKAHGAVLREGVEVVEARARGHVYLELSERDSSGQPIAKARAIIWSSTASRILPEFEKATGAVIGAGIKLLVRAKPVFSAQYGFSLEIDAIDPDYTLGDLEARKKEIRSRLQQEGVFDHNRRLTPPWDYRTIVVVAPEDGAGFGDFRKEAERLEHFGICRFIYVHSRFQGEGAAREIVSAMATALEQFGKADPPDAVVLIRGGGAVNDLAGSTSTTSHSVEAASVRQIHDAAVRSIALLTQTRADAARHLATAKQQVPALMNAIRVRSQKNVGDARGNSNLVFQAVLSSASTTARTASQSMDDRMQRLAERAQGTVQRARTSTEALMREVTGQGPEKTLGRGFAIVRTPDGKPVTASAQAQALSTIDIQFRDGRINARATSHERKAHDDEFS